VDVNKIRLTSKSQKELLFSSPNQNNLHQVLHILPHQLLPREMHDSASFSEFHWGFHPRPRPIMPALRMHIDHNFTRQMRFCSAQRRSLIRREAPNAEE